MNVDTMSDSAMTLTEAHSAGFELVRQHTARFLDYVIGLDSVAAATRVPGSDWTVADTVAHVRSVVRRYTRDRGRADTHRDLASRNGDDIAESGVDIGAAATDIREQIDFLSTVVGEIDPARRFPFHGGQTVTLAGGWGNLLGELLAHGDDIARVTHTTFTIPSADLEVLWRFTGHLLAGWLRDEAGVFDDTWTLRFPFGAIDIGFDRGALRWAVDHAGNADHLIEIDDVAEFTLGFPYRRRPITDPATALLAARFHDL